MNILGLSRIVLFAALLFTPLTQAAPRMPSAGTQTPWPRVLPCSEFARLRFLVLVPMGETNKGFDGIRKEVVWTTKTGSALRFRGEFGTQDPVAERISIDPNFPARQLSAITVTGSARGTELAIWLGCADEPSKGIEWNCRDYPRCSVAAVYGKESAYQWPESRKETGLSERLPSTPKPGPLGPKARAELLGFLREQSAAAVSWLDTACRGGRCTQAIENERAQLHRFLHAESTRVISTQQKMDRENEHYRAGYPTFDLTAAADGARVSIKYDELGWALSVGQLTCDGACFLNVAAGGTIGGFQGNAFMHAIDPQGFVIQGQALAMDE